MSERHSYIKIQSWYVPFGKREIRSHQILDACIQKRNWTIQKQKKRLLSLLILIFLKTLGKLIPQLPSSSLWFSSACCQEVPDPVATSPSPLAQDHLAFPSVALHTLPSSSLLCTFIPCLWPPVLAMNIGSFLHELISPNSQLRQHL